MGVRLCRRWPTASECASFWLFSSLSFHIYSLIVILVTANRGPWAAVAYRGANATAIVVGRFLAPASDVCCASSASLNNYAWPCADAAAAPCPPRSATDALLGACESCASNAAAAAMRLVGALLATATAFCAAAFCVMNYFGFMVWAEHPCARGASARLRALLAAYYCLQGAALALVITAGAAAQGAVDAYKAAVQPPAQARTSTLPLGSGWRVVQAFVLFCGLVAASLLISMVASVVAICKLQCKQPASVVQEEALGTAQLVVRGGVASGGGSERGADGGGG
jgi:hypothetical protein